MIEIKINGIQAECKFDFADGEILSDDIRRALLALYRVVCEAANDETADKADGCEKVCGVVKQRITSAKDAETRKAERQQREDAFMKSPLAMARRHIKLALAGVGITSYEDLENFPERWYTDWLWDDPLDCHAPDLDDLFRLVDWAGVDPFEMIAGRPEAKIWHEYPAEQPPEAVPLLCRKDNGSYGEYVRWEDGWRFAEDQDCPASVTVTHWTEVTPE